MIRLATGLDKAGGHRRERPAHRRRTLEGFALRGPGVYARKDAEGKREGQRVGAGPRCKFCEIHGYR